MFKKVSPPCLHYNQMVALRTAGGGRTPLNTLDPSLTDSGVYPQMEASFPILVKSQPQKIDN